MKDVLRWTILAMVKREVVMGRLSGSTFTLRDGGTMNECVNTDTYEFFYHFKWFANFLE